MRFRPVWFILLVVAFFLPTTVGILAYGKATESKYGFTSPTAQPFTVSTSSAGIAGNSATTTNFFGSALPQVNNLYDLGSSPSSWRDVYASGTLFVSKIGATSGTFTNLTWVNATGTNTTSTNLFVTNYLGTNATTTNLVTTNFSATSGTFVGLTWVSATGTNTTSTNLGWTNGAGVNTTSTFLSFTYASGTYVTSSVIYVGDGVYSKISENTSPTTRFGQLNDAGAFYGYQVAGGATSILIGDAFTMRMNGVGVGFFLPITAVNAGLDIGSNGTAFRDFYASGTQSLFTGLSWGSGTGTNTTSTNLSFTTATGSSISIDSLIAGGASILPKLNNTTNLGSALLSFANIFASGTLNFVNATGSKGYSNVSSTALFSDLLKFGSEGLQPVTNNSGSLGSAQYSIGNIFASGTESLKGPLTIAGSIAGVTNNVSDIGSPAISFGNIYTSGTLFFTNATGTSVSTTNLTVTGLVNTTAVLANVCVAANGVITKDTSLSCLASNPKFKDNIAPLEGMGLSTVMSLEPIEWDWKPGLARTGHDFGFNALQAQKVDPRLTPVDENGEVKGFKYQEYTAVLTKAIQEQQKQIETLTKRAKTLERECKKMF